jgi:hypothetical protein
MENNNNNQILNNTNDVPCCLKSLDKQEQTTTNYLAKLKAKKPIGYNYKQKYCKKMETICAIAIVHILDSIAVF